MDVAEARAVIEDDRRRRMEACMAEINEVLARHGMTFDLVQTPAQLTLREAP